LFSIANSHQEADEMDVKQQVAMTADERRAILRKLQRRVYGDNPRRCVRAVRAGSERRLIFQGH
jgi:hypothetical protein